MLKVRTTTGNINFIRGQPLESFTRRGTNMRKSILVVLIVPVFLAVACGAQLCSQEPFSESFGFSSEDFGGGAYLGVDTRDITLIA